METNRYDQIKSYIQSHREDIVSTLIRLARVPSVCSDALPGAPFGAACRAVLEEAARIHAENGFPDTCISDDGYLLTHIGCGEKTIGIFAHGDVVPPGDGWTITEPFDPVVKDGFLVGRGVNDNKSGMLISLYAARAIRDLGLPFSSRLLLFTGSNEESGMADVAAFVKNHGAPDVSLVPDSGFPVYRGEKGILRFWAKSRQKLEALQTFTGGEAFNIILGNADVTLATTPEMTAALEKVCADNPRLTLTKDKDCLKLSAEGISKHAALPDGSLNAAMLLCEGLLATEVLPDGDREQLAFLQSLLSNTDGVSFGINATDPDFGKTTIVNGMVDMQDGHLCAAFDVRYVQNGEAMIAGIRTLLAENGWDMDTTRDSPGFKIPMENPMLQALLHSYSRCTGEENPRAYLNAGGTYARCLPNGYAVGTCFWRAMPFTLPGGHGGVHQPDEVLTIDGLLDAIAVVTEMLLTMDETLTK